MLGQAADVEGQRASRGKPARTRSIGHSGCMGVIPLAGRLARLGLQRGQLLGHVAGARMVGPRIGRQQRAPLAQRGQQRLQEQPHVAGHGHLRGNAAAQLGRLDVDLHVGGVRRRHGARSPVGLHLLEARRQPDDHVGVVEQALGQPRAVGAQAAGRQRMVVGDGAAAGQAGQHGRGQPLGQRAHAAPGARGQHAAAGDQQRAARAGQRVGGGRHRGRLGAGRAGGPDGEIRPALDLGVQHVARQVDVHGPGPPAARDREGPAQHVGGQVGTIDAHRPLGHRGEHPIGQGLTTQVRDVDGHALGADTALRSIEGLAGAARKSAAETLYGSALDV